MARTVRSGSDIVIITPSRKLTKTITHTLFDLVMHEPTLLPIGVIAVSAPTVKNAIPTISITAPVRKDTSILLGIGAIVKHSRSTITVIGSTDVRASFSFSLSSFLLLKTQFLQIIIHYILSYCKRQSKARLC